MPNRPDRSEWAPTRIPRKRNSFWIKLLCRPGLASRIAASGAFASLGLEAGPAIPSLIALLADPELRTRRRAYLVLLRLGLGEKVLARASKILHEEPEPWDEVTRAWRKSRGVPEVSPARAARLRLLASVRHADLDLASGLTFFNALLDDPADPVCDLAARVLRGPWLPAPPEWLAGARSDDPAARVRAAHAAGGIGPEALPVLSLLIRDAEPSVRRVTAVALGRFGAEALAELAIALEDEDEKVRRPAAWALGRPLGPEAVGRLIRALDHPRAGVRHEAITAIKSLGLRASDALPRLERAREDPDSDVSTAARFACSSISERLDGKTLRHWASKLQDPRPRVRRAVARILIYAPRADAIMEALAEIVRDPDPDVRAAARYAFEAGGVQATHPAFLRLLHDPDRRHRLSALEILYYESRAHREDAVSVVVAMLDDPDETVRGWVTHLLARRDDAHHVDASYILPLRESCGGTDDPGDRFARACAAVALGDWDEEGLEPLQAALRDPDTLVRRAAAVAMRRIGAAAIGAARMAGGDDDPDVRVAAAGLISRHDPEAVARLVGFLDDPSPAVRGAAIEGLVPFGPRASVALPWLRRAVAGANDLQVRRAAIAALGEVAPTSPEVVTTLLDAVADPDPQLRIAALEGLGAVNPDFPEVVPALARSLDDPEWRVQCTAVRSLGRIGPKARAAIPVMAGLCSSPVPAVRAHARANLLRLIPDRAEPAELDVVVAVLSKALDSGDWGADGTWGLEALSELAGLGAPRSWCQTAITDHAGPGDPRDWSPDQLLRHPSCARWNCPVPFPAAAKALARAFHHPQADVRSSVVAAFSRKSPEATKVILPELVEAYRTDPDPEVRRACWFVLRGISPEVPEVVPALVAVLADPDQVVRFHAAHDLSYLDPTIAAALPVLIEGLDNPDGKRRRMAAEGLGRLGRLATTAVAALNKAILDPDEPTRNAAANALEQIQGTTS